MTNLLLGCGSAVVGVVLVEFLGSLLVEELWPGLGVPVEGEVVLGI